MDTCNLNTTFRLSGSFTANGVAADPTSVTVTLTDPNGTVSTPAATKDSTGSYHVDVVATVWGVWRCTFAGSGAVVASTPYSFFVEPPV